MRFSQGSLAFWSFFLRWLARLFAAGSVASAALIKFKLSDFGLDVGESGNHVAQKIAYILLPVLLVGLPVVESFRRRLEKKTLAPLVKEILEEFRKQIYPGSVEPSHHHRVTLFKRCTWVARWRCVKERRKGWLKIVERTGHTTQNSRTVFFAPNDPDKAEGVAGAAWAWNRIVVVEDLPDVRLSTAKDSAVTDYANRTNSPVELIRSLKPTSQSLCGIPIEVDGVIWGVIVVDSRHGKLPKELIERHYPLVAKFLGRILERLS